MEKVTAKEILEQIARNLVAVENLSRVVADLVNVEDRKLYSPMLKELLSSNFELQAQIGSLCPDLNPSYLGRESFAKACKNYEDPNFPRALPTDEELEKSKQLWEKIQKMTRK